MTTRNRYLNYGWMVTENGPIYTTFYMRLQKEKVCIEHLHVLVITNKATAHNYEILLRKLCHAFFFFFADCNKLKSKRFEWTKTNTSS